VLCLCFVYLYLYECVYVCVLAEKIVAQLLDDQSKLDEEQQDEWGNHGDYKYSSSDIVVDKSGGGVSADSNDRSGISVNSNDSRSGVSVDISGVDDSRSSVVVADDEATKSVSVDVDVDVETDWLNFTGLPSPHFFASLVQVYVDNMIPGYEGIYVCMCVCVCLSVYVTYVCMVCVGCVCCVCSCFVRICYVLNLILHTHNTHTHTHTHTHINTHTHRYTLTHIQHTHTYKTHSNKQHVCVGKP